MDVVILVNIKLVISALFQDIIQGRLCFYIMGNGDKLRDSICKGGGLVLCSINTVKEDWVIIFLEFLKLVLLIVDLGHRQYSTIPAFVHRFSVFSLTLHLFD